MTFYLKRIRRFFLKPRNERGVALFIVLAAMATLAIFVGEITYVAQVNQKLAYDRLDQIKATALAKSGLRICLLRIRAYTEVQKFIKSSGASAAVASSVVPKAVLEKIWSEPITIPFSGDASSLPLAIRDQVTKFRKDTSMEGKLYISIQAQASRFNLNSTVAAFASAAASATPSPTLAPGAVAPAASTAPSATASPSPFDITQARAALVDQLKQTFQKKFDESPKFRDQYQSTQIENIADEMIGYSDLTYDTQRSTVAKVPFKRAPFYHVSELHYLDTVDDEIYDLIAPQFTASVSSKINVNAITDAVLQALVPILTKEERQKFFDFREGKGDSSNPDAQSSNPDQDALFKSPDDFFKYFKDHVAAFNTDQKVTDFKNALSQRGIQLVTEESEFIVHVEATVQQTKRTLEANVSIVPDAATPTTPGVGGARPTPTPVPSGGTNTVSNNVLEKSNLKITQLRFF
jgi:type II secretory pathway component PulK